MEYAGARKVVWDLDPARVPNLFHRLRPVSPFLLIGLARQPTALK